MCVCCLTYSRYTCAIFLVKNLLQVTMHESISVASIWNALPVLCRHAHSDCILTVLQWVDMIWLVLYMIACDITSITAWSHQVLLWLSFNTIHASITTRGRHYTVYGSLLHTDYNTSLYMYMRGNFYFVKAKQCMCHILISKQIIII